MEANNIITLYEFPRIWGLPNASPFCLKLETYLRLAKIPYETKFVMNPKKAPKAKLPAIKIEDKKLGDSELIIDFLKGKFGNQLDKNLSNEQKALSLVLDISFSERFYWLMLYSRWQYQPNWLHVKEAFFRKLPPILRLIIPAIVRKGSLKALYMQGIGRHSYDQILQMGYQFLDAIANILGDKKYFHGDEPSSIDATAFAFLANIAWLPYDDAFKAHLNKHKNLLRFCDRLWIDVYPEFAMPFALLR